MSLSRREFLRRSALATGALAVPGLAEAEAPEKRGPARDFGTLGFRASIYTIGTAETVDGDASVAAIRAMLESGVNMIDTAPSYQGGRSEQLVGRALEGHKGRVWVSTKTLARTADGAYEEVKASLRRLKLDRIDTLQVHAVNDDATLDAVLRKGGAVEGLERAKRDGLIRHIGITGHTRPAVILRAIREYSFASILVPVSALDAHVHDFAPVVLGEARKRGVAIVGMKALKGMERATGGRFDAKDLLRYAWSLPIDTLAIGLRKPEEAATNLETWRAFKPMSVKEREALEATVKSYANVDDLWWKRQ